MKVVIRMWAWCVVCGGWDWFVGFMVFIGCLFDFCRGIV